MEAPLDVQVLLVAVHATPRAMGHLLLRGVPDVLQVVHLVAQAHVAVAVPALVEVVVPVPADPAVPAAVQVPVEADAAPAVPARAVVDVVQDAPLLAKVDVKGVVLHRVPENVAVPLAAEFVPMSVIEVSVMAVVKGHAKTLVKALASTHAILPVNTAQSNLWQR